MICGLLIPALFSARDKWMEGLSHSWGLHGMRSTALVRLLWSLSAGRSILTFNSSHSISPCPHNQSIFRARFNLEAVCATKSSVLSFRCHSFFPSLLRSPAPDVSRSTPVGNEISRIHMEMQRTFHYIMRTDRRRKWMCEHAGIVKMYVCLCACWIKVITVLAFPNS